MTLGERGSLQYVSVEALSIVYGHRTVLANASLQAKRGEVCLLSGPSGSGKSSLIMCVAGLLHPTAGQVTVDGADLYGLRENDRDALRRESIGLITQDGDLVPELTVIENVALPLRLLGVSAREASARAGAELERFGILDLARSGVDRVSGGQWQRAAIARALVHRPSLVLADEPTAALDQANAQRVIQELRSFATDHHATVLVATHDLRFVPTADRLYTVLDGHVEAA